MAIATKFSDIQKWFNPSEWKNIDEYEAYYLKHTSETSPHPNYYTDRNGKESIIQPVDHHPELSEYEVWMEGYRATGESSGAQLLGKVKARNFAQACHILMAKDYLSGVKKENSPDYKEYIDAGRWDYDPQKLSYWGRRLYWSQELAKKSFG